MACLAAALPGPLSAAAAHGLGTVEGARLLDERAELRARSWTELRDASVIKQRFDYSCGASALASLLSLHYGLEIEERDILERYEFDRTLGVSFTGLAEIARGLGFAASGVSIRYETLVKARVPLLLFVRVDGQGHFSVLKAVSERGVVLADPAWGEIRLTRRQFEPLWIPEGSDRGRALILLPENGQDRPGSGDFFGQDGTSTPVYPLDSGALFGRVPGHEGGRPR